MAKYEILAATSLIINVASFLTIIYNVSQTKRVDTLTWTYLIGNCFGQILLITYGIINKAWGIYLPTTIIFFGLTYLIYVKYMYADKLE